jgi:hypothetical protein
MPTALQTASWNKLGVKLTETTKEPGDVLSHSVLVHHGPRPNDTPEVRWHLEVGVQDLQSLASMH